MRKLVLPFTFIFCLLAQKNFAQITATNTLTPTQMVQQVLLGSGVTVSNVTYTGYVNGRAVFAASPSTNLGMAAGIYLTSGSYKTNDPLGGGTGQDGPSGPSSNFQNVDQNTNGDVSLDAIVAPDNTNDAAVLQFDFIPQSDTVKFRYVFGSEEYDDYVNSFNDVFAFILSGGTTTPLAPTNIALIPGTTIPISINNVNNGQSFTAGTGPCNHCNYYRDNYNGSISCVYDGLTTVLTAKHKVTCGELYHIKIAVADVNDHAFDSGVFLEAGSFSSYSPFAISSSAASNGPVGNNNTVFENCGQLNLVFTRPSTATGVADTLPLTLGGTSSAADYTGLNDTIFFPVGVDTVIVPLTAVNDAVPDSGETLIMSYIYTNSCQIPDTFLYTIVIAELDTMVVDFPNDTTICNSQGISLSAPVIAGGAPNYSYQWSNSGGNLSTASTYNVAHLFTNQTYYVSVTDACNRNLKDTVHVLVDQSLYIVGTFDVICSSNDTIMVEGCDSTVLKFTEQGTGAGIGVHTYNITIGGTATNGSPDITTTIPTTITFNNSTSVQFPFTAIADALAEGGGTGLETLTITINYTGNPCIPLTGQILKVLYIKDLNPFHVDFNHDTTVCLGRPVVLDAYTTGGGGNITYTWNPIPGSGPTQTVFPLDTTTYSVSVHESCGNTTITKSMTVYTLFNPPVVTLPSVDSVCIGDNYSFNTVVSGGVPPLTAGWVQGYSDDLESAGSANAWTIYRVNTGGPFIYLVTDQCSFFGTDTLNLIAEDCSMIVPNIVTPNGDNINDVFYIKKLYKNPETSLLVYDRWGREVFSSANYDNTWKPTELTDGVYFYVLTPKKREKASGFFHVLKK